MRRRSPSNIERVEPYKTAPTGEWLVYTRYRFADGLTIVPREPSPSRHTDCISTKGDCGLGPHTITAPPSWVSTLSLRQQEEFYQRVNVHQKTAVVSTFPFHTNLLTRRAAVPSLKYQRSYLRSDIHMIPGPYKGINR